MYIWGNFGYLPKTERFWKRLLNIFNNDIRVNQLTPHHINQRKKQQDPEVLHITTIQNNGQFKQQRLVLHFSKQRDCTHRLLWTHRTQYHVAKHVIVI